MSKQHLTPRLNRNEPNIIIDGGHEIWPEGTSRSVANNTSVYGAVLFQTYNSGSGVTLTNSQQSAIPSGTNIPYSNQISKTAAGTLAAGTNLGLAYMVEGYDISRIYSQDFSVIFWVKSSVASNRSLRLSNASFTHSYVKQYNISATNTWQLKVVTFPALSACPGTLNRTNGIGIQLAWGVVTGSTYQTSTLNAWQAGNFISGTGEDTTWLTGTNHDFSVAGVMILPGDWSTLASNTSQYQFIRSGRNFQEELAKTQRYYEKGSYGETAGVNNTSIIASVTTPVYFKVTKRTNVPSFTGSTNNQDNANLFISDYDENYVLIGRSSVVANRTNTGIYVVDARF